MSVQCINEIYLEKLKHLSVNILLQALLDDDDANVQI